MAGHDSESSKGKAKEDIDAPIFSAENMQSNMKIIYYSRTFMSIIGGGIAGILGFNGLSGYLHMISCIFSEGRISGGNGSSRDEVAGVKPAIAASALIQVFRFMEATLAA